jgi:phytoene dehydrogenase-like protein
MPPASAAGSRVDVAIVGGGHNALVAAIFLARRDLRVVVLERLGHVGGAAVSERPFAGVDARLSRYSYLVSLFPDALAAELGLDVELRSRATASYTPTTRAGRDVGLLVESAPGSATRESFADLTGSPAAWGAWKGFYDDVALLASVIAPTFLQPLPSAAELRRRLHEKAGDRGHGIWAALVDAPLGSILRDRFDDDVVRGVVATDGLIGTFTSMDDQARLANRCFLYHLVGNGTGEWRVPVGGMGGLTTSLAALAASAGAELRTGVDVTAIEADGTSASIRYVDTASGDERVLEATWVLGGVAPSVLDRLVGSPPTATADRPEGAQLKINLVLTRLPRLRSGIDPAVAFAGTFHVDETATDLELAFAQASAGRLPDRIPGELYCHTLTDRSILGPDLDAAGWHTLTYFGIHTPAGLFAGADRAAVTTTAVTRALTGLDRYLVEPLADVVAIDANGSPCIEVKSPLDVEDELAMPGGHIFHGDLQWPWLVDETSPADPAAAWGVATSIRNVLVCGAGARRGGAVSGIGGHNAAMALLQVIGRR